MQADAARIEALVRLRAETSRLPRGTMQISPEQGSSWAYWCG
jgi:hypothetical protein